MPSYYAKPKAGFYEHIKHLFLNGLPVVDPASYPMTIGMYNNSPIGVCDYLKIDMSQLTEEQFMALCGSDCTDDKIVAIADEGMLIPEFEIEAIIELS